MVRGDQVAVDLIVRVADVELVPYQGTGYACGGASSGAFWVEKS